MSDAARSKGALLGIKGDTKKRGRTRILRQAEGGGTCIRSTAERKKRSENASSAAMEKKREPNREELGGLPWQP